MYTCTLVHDLILWQLRIIVDLLFPRYYAYQLFINIQRALVQRKLSVSHIHKLAVTDTYNIDLDLKNISVLPVAVRF